MGAQEDYERFKAFADELVEDEGKREKFVNDAMSRKGHKPVTTWEDAPPENDDGDEELDSFGNRRKQREQRRQEQKPEGPDKKAAGGGWPYDS